MIENEKANEFIKLASSRSLGLKATKARRKEMVIKVFSFNIQKNKLSKKHPKSTVLQVGVIHY